MNDESKQELGPHLRKLLILLLKLFIDAFRDLVFAVVSLGAFLIDIVQKNTGTDCYFEKVMKLGRVTEKEINLFDEYAPDQQSEQDEQSDEGMDEAIVDVEE